MWISEEIAQLTSFEQLTHFTASHNPYGKNCDFFSKILAKLDKYIGIYFKYVRIASKCFQILMYGFLIDQLGLSTKER